MTVETNAGEIEKLKDAHNQCQAERIRLTVEMVAVKERIVKQEPWGEHARLIMKAIEDLETNQALVNARIWKIVVGVLMCAIGVIASIVKTAGG